MATRYEFKKEVGQVAGGDIKTHSAQAHVDFHFHHGPEVKYITERQRNAIARKVFQIRAKTDVKTLLVYRRLMAVFKFDNMDTMPREKYARAMSYLEGWLRNGTTEQPSTEPTLQEQVQLPSAPRHNSVDSVGSTAASVQPAAPRQPIIIQPVPLTVPAVEKKARWRAIATACGVIGALAAASYVVIDRVKASSQLPAAATVLQCEYGGNRYSIGGVVLQAGIRQQCVETPKHATAWQSLTSGRRH